MSRLAALLEELGQRKVIDEAIVAEIQLAAHLDWAESKTWWEELAGVVDGSEQPVPYVVLKGSIRASLPEWQPGMTGRGTLQKLEIAFPRPAGDRFTIVIQRRYKNGRSEKITVPSSLFGGFLYPHYRYRVVKSLVVRPPPEAIAETLLAIAGHLAAESGVSEEQILQALKARICSRSP